MIKEELSQILNDLVKELFALDVDTSLERPRDPSHGDFASNISMQIAGKLSKNPREVAESIKASLESMKLDWLDSIEIAGPGFINFKIKKVELTKILEIILKEEEKFGKSDLGKNKKVMIEFGQPNTHKAFHVGHLKSAISGLAMVKLHENLGYEVIKANFYGDVGMHVAKTTWGWLNSEIPSDFEGWNVHKQMKFIDECYVKGANEFKENKEAENEIREINKDIYAEVKNKATEAYETLRKISLQHQKDIWNELGITYDREYPESEVYKEAVKIVNEYKDKIFEQSEGAWIYDGKKEGLTTWVFLTSEGNPTYSAKDLGLAYKKFEKYPDLEKGIVTTSVEIADYFKVVIHVLSKIKPETKGRYFHIPFGWMLQGGRKFSSRMGGSIKGMDILDEVKSVAFKKISDLKEYSEEEKKEIVDYVANAGLKFLILSHEFHKDFSYDPEQFLSFEGFSGPYILYTYARAKSILRKAGEQNLNVSENSLSSEIEQDVLKALNTYPEVAKDAGINFAPHLIANYLYDLSQKYNKFYTEIPVINAEKEDDKNARLMLTKATAQVIKNGLNLLGIETLERM